MCQKESAGEIKRGEKALTRGKQNRNSIGSRRRGKDCEEKKKKERKKARKEEGKCQGKVNSLVQTSLFIQNGRAQDCDVSVHVGQLALICRLCQFPWCQYSLHGPFHAAVLWLNTDLEIHTRNWPFPSTCKLAQAHHWGKTSDTYCLNFAKFH